MPRREDAPRQSPADLQPPTTGAGPLFQRDYWAVIDRCRMAPSEVIAMVAARFSEFPPEDMVVFSSRNEPTQTLRIGDELDIRIRMAGTACVRVVHQEACSFTLATLDGHPEAGRITFGAYRNERHDVIFHIRSRARSSSLFTYVGFRTGGDPMQTSTWADFVNTVALTCGAGVVGEIRADTVRLEPTELDEGDEAMDRPTYVAKAD